jgi:PAS domain S-box-containing protein
MFVKEDFKNDRILIIDDNEEIHRDYKKILAPKKPSADLDALGAALFGEVAASASNEIFQLDSAFQGQEGHEKALTALQAGQPYALAFVDMRMPPGWDGLKTAEHLLGSDPNLEIVICTAYSEHSWRQIFDRIASANERVLILRKPFDAIEVKQLAHALTRRWQLRCQARVIEERLENLVAERTRQLERQKRASEEAEKKLRAVLDATSDAIMILDADGNINDANRVAKKMTSAATADPVGANIYEVMPSERATAVGTRLTQFGPQPEPKTFEDRHEGNSFDNRLFPIIDSNNNACLSVWFSRDITDIRRAESLLAQSQKLENMGMLAAGLAHEIKNPLSAVLYNMEYISEGLPQLLAQFHANREKVCTSLVQKRVDEGLTAATMTLNLDTVEEVQDRLRDSLDGIRRIHSISKDISAFSRGVEEEDLVVVNLNTVIESAVNICFNQIKYKARLVKNYENIPTFMAWEGRLAQVFVNLLVNGAHAINQGDVEENEIRVTTWTEENVACASVRDTGKGIPAQQMDQLFDPFFTTKDVQKGSGLGLSISKSIVEKHGGSIDVESELGKGTTFFIRIPFRHVSLAPLPGGKRRVSDQSPSVSGRILIIDDEKCIRVAMSRMFSAHEVIEACDGAAAKEILETDQAFDLILCDLMMPRLNGTQLHRWLFGENPVLASRIIFITGGAFDPRIRSYLNRLDNLTFEKPFNTRNMKKIVADCIQLARQTEV